MAGIILFDGICNFCDSTVQFIIKHDEAGYFQFASLQSDIGQALLNQYNIPKNIDSVILIEQGNVSLESTAALNICRKLDGLWPCFYALILVPPLSVMRCIDYLLNNAIVYLVKKVNAYCPHLLNGNDFFPSSARVYNIRREWKNTFAQDQNTREEKRNTVAQASNQKHNICNQNRKHRMKKDIIRCFCYLLI